LHLIWVEVYAKIFFVDKYDQNIDIRFIDFKYVIDIHLVAALEQLYLRKKQFLIFDEIIVKRNYLI